MRGLATPQTRGSTSDGRSPRARNAALLVALMLLAGLAPVWSVLSDDPLEPRNQRETQLPTAAQAGRPIEGPSAALGPALQTAFPIDSDQELLERAAARAWAGTGSPDNPIRIDGLTLETQQRTGLRLRDTTLHVVIHNPLITTAGEADAIFLDHVENVAVEGGQLTGGIAGLRLRDSQHVTVANVTFEGGRYGVLLHGAQDVAVQGCAFLYQQIGVYGDASPHVGPSRAISITNNSFVGITSATATSAALAMHGAEHVIASNHVQATDAVGIWVLSDHTQVVNNVVRRAGTIGIFVLDADATTIERNQIDLSGTEGVRLDGSRRAQVIGNHLVENAIGIGTSNDADTMLTDNQVQRGGRAVVLQSALQASIINNVLIGQDQALDVVNGHGVDIVRNMISGALTGGINIFSTGTAQVTGNTVQDGLHIGIFAGADSHDIDISENQLNRVPNGIVIDAASASTVRDNTVTGPGLRGIHLGTSGDMVIQDNRVTGFEHGITVYQPKRATYVQGGVLADNLYGLRAGPGPGSVHVNDTEVSFAMVGIQLSGLGQHTVHHAYIHDNTRGLILIDARDVTVAHNRLSANRIGLHFTNATGNLLYDNALLNDALPGDRDALVERSGPNQWNISRTAGPNIMGGPWVGGNFWSAYRGTDAEGDGIGDVPYGPAPMPRSGQSWSIAGTVGGPIDLLPLMAEADPDGNDARSPLPSAPDHRPSAEEVPLQAERRDEPQQGPQRTHARAWVSAPSHVA